MTTLIQWTLEILVAIYVAFGLGYGFRALFHDEGNRR